VQVLQERQCFKQHTTERQSPSAGSVHPIRLCFFENKERALMGKWAPAASKELNNDNIECIKCAIKIMQL
jgi:hypothetical protein